VLVLHFRNCNQNKSDIDWKRWMKWVLRLAFFSDCFAFFSFIINLDSNISCLSNINMPNESDYISAPIEGVLTCSLESDIELQYLFLCSKRIFLPSSFHYHFN